MMMMMMSKMQLAEQLAAAAAERECTTAVRIFFWFRYYPIGDILKRIGEASNLLNVHI